MIYAVKNIKGKTKIELPKTTNADKMTLEYALGIFEKKKPKRKVAAKKNKEKSKQTKPKNKTSDNKNNVKWKKVPASRVVVDDTKIIGIFSVG